MEVDVIIVGAGVGGASCALALAKAHNLQILLVERHLGPGNLNRGESLLPPITALLRRWGALDRCRAAGAREVGRMQFFHYRAGLLLDVPLTLPGVTDPYLVLPHPEIERVIVETAQATGRVEIRYRTRVVRLLENGGRVCGAVLASDGGREEEVHARLVVGSDGAASAVRAAVGIELPRTQYNHALFIVDIDRPAGHPDVLRTELHPDGGILVVPGVGRPPRTRRADPARAPTTFPVGLGRGKTLEARGPFAAAGRPASLSYRRTSLQIVARARVALLGSRRSPAR